MKIKDPQQVKKIVSDLLIGKMVLSVGLRGVDDWGDCINLEDVVLIEIEGGIFLHISGNYQIDRADVDFYIRHHSDVDLDPDDGPVIWVNS